MRETSLRVNAGANISKEDAEEMGLHIGAKIIYKELKRVKNCKYKIVERKATVYALWKHIFIVIWDDHKYKEALQYRLLAKGSLKNCGEGVEIV